MGKIFIEYEQCQCNKLEKSVTITSMVFEEANEEVQPCPPEERAFDCDQKKSCGVLTVLGKSGQVNWTGCTHQKLAQRLETAAG